MNQQMETLLEIQDLKSQRGDLVAADAGSSLEEELFNISIEEAVQQLDEKIREMEESLESRVRGRYQRLGSRGRFIVPVINGTCFGCFVSIPTAVASEADRNAALHHCDNCGRFLYLTD